MSARCGTRISIRPHIRQIQTGVDANGDPTYQAGFKEFYLGDTWKPRVAVGFGVNWNSPFGPFRIDVAKALVKQDGDDTKLFQFNVGTQF